MSDATPVSFVADPGRLPTALAEATGSIVYRSAGACLLIGPLDDALQAMAELPSLSCTVVTIDPAVATTGKRLLETGTAVFTVASLSVTGHLGDFSVLAGADSLDLAVATWRESGRFDLVVDLQPHSLIAHRLPPPGYAHVPPGTDPHTRGAALAGIDALVGEFEKPRYFDWTASLCAHSRSSLNGCSRCIDVCVTGAITPAGDGVAVDPYLCQGCGSCATVCPTGAMRYAYPPVADAVRRTRTLLDDAATPAAIDTLVLHIEEHAPLVEAAVTDPSVLDLAVEQVSAFGLDYWLTLLAGGIGRIVLVVDAPDDDPNRRALEEQAALLHALLSALPDVQAGIEADGPVLHLCTSGTLADTLASTRGNPALRAGGGARFDLRDAKRQTLRAALDVLAERHAPSHATTPLPLGAPFGRVRVDTTACTLCMACVSTCPAGALLDGQDRPALRFIEANCVQCGLCEQACPESAIVPEARYRWDSVEARRTEVLHEEEPFNCILCHKAFATRGVIDTMLKKLSGHWMFEDPKALRRLKMCEDCRVKDLFENEPEGPVVHRDGRDADAEEQR